GSGDFDGFLRDVETLKRMARVLVKGWQPDAYGASSYAEQTAEGAIGAAPSGGMLTKDQCARLVKMLDGYSPLPEPAEPMALIQRWTLLDLEQLVATGQTAVLKEAVGPAQYWE